MTATRRPTLDQLRTVYLGLTSEPGITAERLRQYTSVMHELDRAAAENVIPPQGPLTHDTISQFLAAAEDGLFRSSAARSGPTAPTTNRTRIGCLNALSTRAGLPLDLQHCVPAPALMPGTTSTQAASLRRYLSQQNNKPLLDDDHARILLAIGLTLDTRGRSGELAAMLTADITTQLKPGHRRPTVTARLRLNPQRRPASERILTSPIELHPTTVAALNRYRLIRERLVAELRAWAAAHPDQDADPHHDYLFVSLAPNHTGGRPSPEGGTPLRPAGMPLQPQGLRRALDRAATRINTARGSAARQLPTMEQLRRIVEDEQT
ncbi:hypothetical protein [Kitasatospora sp. NPDC087315]|uniref:hypothetical protein n=1 Tax=Kitasatospora sp. NPDC087315 TaxID=3364069 RepID=UPI00382A76F4